MDYKVLTSQIKAPERKKIKIDRQSGPSQQSCRSSQGTQDKLEIHTQFHPSRRPHLYKIRCSNDCRSYPRRRQNSLVYNLMERQLGRGNIDNLLRIAENISIARASVCKRAIRLPTEAKCTIAVTVGENDTVISTHGGDHTVKISSYFTGEVKATLARHVRTPWTIAIHPEQSALIASGCLNGTVCVWLNGQLYREALIREELIMSLNFFLNKSTKQSFLILALGKFVWFWDYEDEAAQPEPVLERLGRVQCICFSPFFNFMISAEQSPPDGSTCQVSCWKSVSHEDDIFPIKKDKPLKHLLVLDRAVLYSDGGLSLSKCGRFLLVIRRSSHNSELLVLSLQTQSFGKVIRKTLLTPPLSSGITSVKFSPTSDHIVCGYGVTHRQTIGQEPKHKCFLSFFSNYFEDGEELKLISSHCSPENESDDVNVAIFYPKPGFGILFGTRQGPLKILG